MTKIYKTIKDTTREGDSTYDAKLIPFDGSNKVFHYFANPNMYGVEKLPKKIFFLGNFEYIGKYDLPFIDSSLYVFSKKMTRILKEFNDFDFIEVPVIMIDDTFNQKPFDKEGNLNPNVAVNEHYVALRFSELKEYFDFENSEYTVPSYDPNGVGIINKLVLREPKKGFPSLFRTIQKVTTIFVREDLKKALEASDIKGCIFEEVEVTPYQK